MRQSALCTVILLTVCMAGSAAAVEDPKQSCETLARVIGEADANKLADSMRSQSREGMDRSAETGAEKLIAYVKQQGQFNLVEFMVEREYGKRFRAQWYMVLFEDSLPLYLYCAYVNPDNEWQLVDILFNTDFEELPPP